VPQSRLDKFHHAHRRYWEAVGTALIEQYHRDPDTASDWACDKMIALDEENGKPTIPDEKPERMAQEIFMERIDV
jgi:hypothetical protein